MITLDPILAPPNYMTIEELKAIPEKFKELQELKDKLNNQDYNNINREVIKWH